jgi:hypothetical protein
MDLNKKFVNYYRMYYDAATQFMLHHISNYVFLSFQCLP